MKTLKGYRKVLLIYLVILLDTCLVHGAIFRLGLFYGKEVRSMVFSVMEGEYILSGDGNQVAVIRKGNMFHIEITGNMMAVQDTSQTFGSYRKLEFRGVSFNNVFRIKPVFPSLPSKESEENLTFDIRDDALRIINMIDLEHYIPGTIEAEGGPNAPVEYYKAQAVLSRTYAINNFTRHGPEGFNLCDGVHCQVFNGKSRLNPEIYKAVRETRDAILATSDGKPIITAFHACCGGITSSASMAWNKDLPYLVSIHDPFCDNASGRNWNRKLSIGEWNDYLKRKGIAEGTADLAAVAKPGRHKYLEAGQYKIPLATIREDLDLASSYFVPVVSGESVILVGHGFGHGVGMCQQGAMEMARVGYTFLDILMFYFGHVRLERR